MPTLAASSVRCLLRRCFVVPVKRDELPVVAHAYRLAGDATGAVARMPHGLRTALGSELVREAVGLCASLQQGALHRSRAQALETADVHLTRLRVLVRLAFDQRGLGFSGLIASALRRRDPCP